MIKAAADSRFGEDLFVVRVFSLCPYIVEEARELMEASFLRALISLLKASPS